MKNSFVLLPFLICLSFGARADILPAAPKPFLCPLFSDNMVLQRDQKDAVWGWSKPGDNVTVAIGGQSESAVADQDGKWTVMIQPPVVGGPYQLDVTGPQEVHLKNVMVGDVWICSGQSNMTLGIKLVKNGAAEIAAGDHPDLRLFSKDNVLSLNPTDEVGGSWHVCSPTSLYDAGMGYSAVAYFFGRDLQADLKIPVGLLHTSWGGTPIEGWTSESALTTATGDFAKTLQLMSGVRDQMKSGGYDYDKLKEDWYQQVDSGMDKAARDYDDSSWGTIKLPASLDQSSPDKMPPSTGVVYFRKTIELPDDVAGRNGTILFGMVKFNDQTLVNGKVVGADTSNSGRTYFIPNGILKPGANIIAVRTFDRGSTAAGIYGTPDQLKLNIDGHASISLAGDWKYKVGPTLASAPEFPPKVMDNSQMPAELFNGMVAPLIPFGIKGVVWYQGESNAGRAYQYRTLLPTLIADWRARWQQGDFPFLVVQLANFDPVQPNPGESDWAELREAQALTTQKVANTGLATAIDIGEAGNIHPRNKQEIGRRLALAAEALAYHDKVEDSGPVYQSMQAEGNTIRITFTHADGLQEKDGYPIDAGALDASNAAPPPSPPPPAAPGTLKGFAIAGHDHRWVWADAKIDGKDVVVSSPQVVVPTAVRYDWAKNPQGNLYNSADLPALPFRTDDWPLTTLKNK